MPLVVLFMPRSGEPEILPPGAKELAPRVKRASGLFADENLDLLARVLDEWFRIPGTSIRFGLDGIIGLIPGLGDVIGGLASSIIVAAAWFRGVPYAALLRMVVNIGIEVVVGVVPVFGDAFDIAWKANRRNYELLVRHLHEPRRHNWKDWVFLWLIGVVLVAIFCAPLVLIALLIMWLRRGG